MNVDDLHFWRRGRGGQGVFFGIKKGGEDFFRGKKGERKLFLVVQNPQNPARVPYKFWSVPNEMVITVA